MLKKCAAVLLTAVLMMSAGCEQQQPPVEEKPPVENPPSIETTTPTLPPDEKPEPPEQKPPDDQTVPQEPVVKGKQVEDLNVKVYYPDESGLKLVEVERQIEVKHEDEKYAAAIEAMMTPPKEKELAEIFPKYSKLLSVEVEDGLATVNFDEGLQKHFVGGSAGETFLVGSVVNALTNFDEVKEVRFLIDGKEVETLAGHMDLSMPLERMDYLTDNQ